MNSGQKHFSMCLLAATALSAGAPAAWSQASSFAVLGNAAVSCTDGNITGQVGTNQPAPSGAITLVTCPTSGSHVGDQAAKAAYAAFLTRYDAVKPKPGDVCTTLTGTLSNATLAPGFYCFPAAATLTGVLTLDGPSTATWTFKIGSTTGALTGTNFSVVMAGGGQACNVTWWTAEAATMTDSNLAGTILAGGAITETRGTQRGSAFSQAGSTITGTAIVGCATEAGPGPGPLPGPGSCTDKVTGGGTIKVGLYSDADFGVGAGIRNGTPRGHLTYVDHSTGMKVKSTSVISYIALDARTRRIGGTAKVNGQSGFTYQVDVADNGEPGRNDTFAMTVSGAGWIYSSPTVSRLAGGNVQLHERHCDRNGHDRDDDEDDRDDDRDGDDDHGQRK